ncbi:MAG: hypothetical protein ABWY50_06965 [Aeromicrobium sp.]
MAEWQTFAVELKGESEPVVVQTAAQDWAGVKFQADGIAVATLFEVTHKALLRIGHPVPRDRNGYLELLAGMPELVAEGDDDALDPTQPDPWEGSQ